MQKNFTKKELMNMAKSEGIKYYYKLNKHELAKRLDIELP